MSATTKSDSGIAHPVSDPAPSPGAPGLAALQRLASAHAARLGHELVQHTLRLRSGSRAPFTRVPPFSVLNRRRRAARLWVNAILGGDTSPATMRNLTRSWLPQLTGTGPEPRRAAPSGPGFVEFLRGALAAVTTPDGPVGDLTPVLEALNAGDHVLRVHLEAIVAEAGAD
ncbi:MAG: hypothetical protein O2865_15090 [Planctomycetota bacterium]|nr:hypothetical protein [Planctomycetota bacterium]